MASNNVPPALPLSSTAQIEVFVHRTYPAPTGEPHGNERLRMLGRRILIAAYVDGVRDKHPALKKEDQLQQYVETHYPQFIRYWVDAYGWMARMRAVPHGVDINNLQEKQCLFETYAGAVMAEQQKPDGSGSPNLLFNWVKQLVSIYG